MSNKKMKDGMKQVGIIKEIYELTGDIMCRCCRQMKEPISTGDFNSMNGTEKEQYYSGICSDKCWDKATEDELMEHKFMFPVYLHKDCVIQKVNMIHPINGMVIELDHNKNPIYKRI
tara:strand:+ start:545 stop:895 length:351 start_codon:yes stop_codon:yes gene_type:complete